MQCDEKKQICLNYAANVPEWQLDMALQAVADIGAACSDLGKVQKAVAGDMAWLRAHPGEDYLGTIPIDRVKACTDAAGAMGAALYALEVILAQSDDQFGFAKGMGIHGRSCLQRISCGAEKPLPHAWVVGGDTSSWRILKSTTGAARFPKRLRKPSPRVA